MFTLRDTVSSLAPARREDLGKTLYDRFREEPDTLIIPVLDDEERPIGLVERNAFFLRMAAEYGRALYANRPISALMDVEPLVVDADTALADFTTDSLSYRASDLLRGFIVTDHGRYLGVGTVLALLQAANESNRRGVAELAAAKADAERAQTFMTAVVEAMPSMVFVKRADDHRYVLLNRAGEKTMGFSRAEMIGRTDADFFSPEQAAIYFDRDREVVESGEVRVIEEDLVPRKDGSLAILRTKKIAINDAEGRPEYLLGVSEDIADRKRAEAQIARLAHYDPLTELPNRLLLIDRLRQNVLTARHEQRSFGLLRIDIDRLSSINGKFGRAIGDQVLQYVAACIQGCLNEPDTLARMDGDEFAVLSMSVTDLDQAIALAQQIRQSIHQPLEIAGRQLGVTASVGVVMFPHHGDDPETLLSAAGEALRLARQSPRGYRIYSADMKAGMEDRVALVHELRDAIANNGLALHYQPKVDIGTDQVSGVEALVRWPHPANGLMLPEQFLPLAEQTDLIQPLTDWVLETAMQQVQAWRREGVHLPVSVKITAASVQNPEFPKQMAERLKRLDVPAASIEIELKDSSAITDSEQALNCLRQLKEMGFQIAIGDFGTGDSPLLFLTEYLVANLKLDKSLVQSMAESKGGIMAVRSAVNLGRTLGLQVVAKGVESQDSWNVLRGFGCNSAQGFYMSGPLSPPDLMNWLQSSPRAPAAHGA